MLVYPRALTHMLRARLPIHFALLRVDTGTPMG
jgi:hypothetical protein